MARKKDEVTWVTMGPDPFLATCLRCGKTIDKPELGIPLDALLAYLRYATELHRNCPPREDRL